MKFKYSFKDVANLLTQDVERTCRHLLPKGKRQGNEWCVGSLGGETGKSLKVHLGGDKAGIWCDFATGQGGDLIELWKQVHDISAKEAIINAKNWLGIKDELPRFLSLSTKKDQKFERPKSATGFVQATSAVGRYLVEKRKLTLKTLAKYKIGECQFKGRAVIVFPYIRNGELIMSKNLCLDRPNEKKEISVTPNSEPCLFGWDMVSGDARSIAIFEGEIDAMTAYQYGIVRFNLGEKTKEPIGMLSVPFGGGTGNKHKWIEYDFDRLSLYDEIYICMDSDAEGQLAVGELIKRLGRHRCSIVEFPYKDINECLEKGVLPATIQECFNSSKSADPKELVCASKYERKVIESFAIDRNPELANSIKDGIKLGYYLPWEELKNNVKLRPKSLSVVTGINGHGKSQLLGQIVLHCIKQGAKACIASLEMNPTDLLKRLIRQSTGTKLPLAELSKNVFGWFKGKLFLFDHVGSVDTGNLLEVFTYASRKYGIDIFVVDSLMKCGICGDDYNEQKRFIDKLCEFKDANDCHIFLVAHPRKAEDEYAPPGKMDISGTADITNLADYCFTVWRNIIKEDGVQSGNVFQKDKPDASIRCTKQRGGDGWLGTIALWFDKDSCQFRECYEASAKPIMDFSINKNNNPRVDENGEAVGNYNDI